MLVKIILMRLKVFWTKVELGMKKVILIIVNVRLMKVKVLETKMERVEVRLLKGPGILVCPECCERGHWGP